MTEGTESQSIFAEALGLTEPWFVEKTEFREEEGKSRALHIYVSFRKDAKFPVPGDPDSELCAPVDSVRKNSLFDGFFQFPCHIHARVPRVQCSDGSIQAVEVPWEHPEESDKRKKAKGQA